MVYTNLNRIQFGNGDVSIMVSILNEEHQREALIKMAEDFIYLNPPDHQRWLSCVVSAIANLGEDG